MLLLATSVTVHADVLFQHPFPPPGITVSGCTSCQGTGRAWDRFVLSDDSSVTQIDARLLLLNLTLGLSASPLNYSVWSSDLSTELFSKTFLMTDLQYVGVAGQNTAYDVTAIFTDLDLTAGTYYLSIYGSSSGDLVAWNRTLTSIDQAGFQALGASPFPIAATGQDYVFRIIGGTTSVPEPQTGGLLLLGLLLAGLVKAAFKSNASPNMGKMEITSTPV